MPRQSKHQRLELFGVEFDLHPTMDAWPMKLTLVQAPRRQPDNENIFLDFDMKTNFVNVADMVKIVSDNPEHFEFWGSFDVAVEQLQQLVSCRVEVVLQRLRNLDSGTGSRAGH